jgi:hypothetical protein
MKLLGNRVSFLRKPNGLRVHVMNSRVVGLDCGRSFYFFNYFIIAHIYSKEFHNFDLKKDRRVLRSKNRHEAQSGKK